MSASIAIIGLGCRFPGASTPQAFWELLCRGGSAITEVPGDRWDVEALYSATPNVPGTMNTRWGGFLEAIDRFDAEFFGIAPREAERMDPQQRLVLEVAWEALEDAGLAPDSLAGSQTGVFIGIGNYDYSQLVGQTYGMISAYNGTGNSFSIAANRLSYVLDLHGPSLAIDTACSSSLVALHTASQSLRSGESNLCIVGGVNAIITPETSILLSQGQMLSPTGQCHTFDANADGYVRGEGCGVVILKRLEDAIRDGDRIQAVIRGSAVNQDGLTNGLTAPNGPAQQAVIRQALANAGVNPTEISYVETHGTGTVLGDPIEVKALKAVLMAGRHPESPCWLGSVKTNIGHLEAAAGIAGVIKTVLALQHQTIPAHRNFNQLNPYISLKDTSFIISTELQSWESPKPRFAGVSAFGFGGTNCHVILEEAPATSTKDTVARSHHLFTLSAKNESALAQLAQNYAEFLETSTSESLADICFTANTGRSRFPHQIAVVADSVSSLSQALRSLGTGQTDTRLIKGTLKRRQSKLAFLFTGQGCQYDGMGRQLYETQPLFQQVIDRCSEIVQECLDISLLDILFNSKLNIHETQYAQPALFALEYAIAQVWISWGVQPQAVMGHSLGEYVAACVAGVLSLEDALKLVCERSRLMQQVSTPGAMVAVFADEATIRKIVDFDGVAIAAYNGPTSLVLSGEKNAIAQLSFTLAQSGVETKPLTVSQAFHSPLMDEILDQFRSVAESITYHAPKIDWISNVMGQVINESDINPDYWCQHLRQPVQFAASLETLQQQGYTTFVEIGPKPVLIGMGRRCLTGEQVWLPSLHSAQANWETLLSSLVALSWQGISINWAEVEPGRAIVLPTYPFQRQRYWVETPASVPSKVAATPKSNELNLTKIGELITPRVEQFKQLPEVQIYGQAFGKIESLTVRYIVSALSDLGFAFSLRDRFTSDELAKTLKVIEPLWKPFNRMMEILAEEGILQADGNAWEVISVPPTSKPEVDRQELIDAYPSAIAELTLLGRTAPVLADLLRGKARPLPLLFPNGDFSIATQLYQESPGSRVMNLLAQQAVSGALETLPPGRSLRVLEIGAGTGGTTAHVLPCLPSDRTEYWFTDVSPGFFPEAQNRFQSFPFIHYQRLDLEKDPLTQGFVAQQFDIIIAANVLHATRDLSQTMRYVQQLLAPEGLLVLLEASRPQRWLDLTFGLTDGWWRFTDTELRPNYPLLSGDRWQEFLPTQGFNPPIVIAPTHEQASLHQLQALILASANSQLPVVPSVGPARPELPRAIAITPPQALPSPYLGQIKSASANQRQLLIAGYLQDLSAKALGLPSNQLRIHDPLNQLGLDSLMVMELRNRIRADFNIEVPVEIWMQGISVDELATYLNQQMIGATPLSIHIIQPIESSLLVAAGEQSWVEGEL